MGRVPPVSPAVVDTHGGSDQNGSIGGAGRRAGVSAFGDRAGYGEDRASGSMIRRLAALTGKGAWRRVYWYWRAWCGGPLRDAVGRGVVLGCGCAGRVRPRRSGGRDPVAARVRALGSDAASIGGDRFVWALRNADRGSKHRHVGRRDRASKDHYHQRRELLGVYGVARRARPRQRSSGCFVFWPGWAWAA